MMHPHENRHITIDRDEQDTVSVTFDVQGKAINVFDGDVISELEAVVARLEQTGDVRAVIFRSGKPSGFLAGADVKQIAALDNVDDVCQIVARGQQLFDRIEQLPMPTVAAIHGPCLGGGLELALACRYRIAMNNSQTRLGLPEVKLGLLPAWGGTQRLPRLIGPAAALPMILKGSQLPAGKALRLGLVDLAPQAEDFEPALYRFVGQLVKDETTTKPRRLSVPDWLLNRTRLGRWLVCRTAKKRVSRQARNYPALNEIVNAVRIGQSESIRAGLEYEQDAFSRLLFSPTCRNLLNLFFHREKARNAKTWASKTSEHLSLNQTGVLKVCRIGVIGAGAMGSGIAQLAAYHGFHVVLKDINQEVLAAGMLRIRQLFDEAIQRGRLSRSEADERLAAITPTVHWDQLATADLVIEAVVERVEIKQQVFSELEKWLPESALLVSNTSSLSVDELSRTLERPGRLAGLHFFNPVHRMELVEVVRTPATDVAAVQQLVQLVRKLGKTPVVVNDSPGFLVNRILFPYLAEAVEMVREGMDIVTIDRRMKVFGMPIGPLELLDQIGLDIAVQVANTMTSISRNAASTAEFLSTIVDQGNLGRKAGFGFYVYRDDHKERPANGWRTAAVVSNQDVTLESEKTRDIQSRLVLSIINEAARCLEEHVTDAPWIIDLAMVLGTGFAPFRGGPLRLSDAQSSNRIVDELERLQAEYGNRFTPCNLLKEMAGWNAAFYQARSSESRSAAASPNEVAQLEMGESS